MLVGDAFSSRYALCHLCFCWVNKLEMKQCSAEEACSAQHSQEALAEYFQREQEACAVGLGLRAAAAARAIYESNGDAEMSNTPRKGAKTGGIKKKPASRSGKRKSSLVVKNGSSRVIMKRPAKASGL